MPAKKARAGVRGERRRELLGHALAVFGEKGYHGAKVEDIVSRAGVAHGTFYLYFADKRATFAELLDSFVARLRVAIHRLDPREPIREQIAANVDRVLDILLAERGFARILLSHAVGIDREFDRKLLNFYEAVAAMLEQALALGQRMRVIRPCDVRLAACALLGMVKEVVYRIVMGGYDAPRKRLARELVEQSLSGLLAEPRAERKKRPLAGAMARRRQPS